jgi:hypothetical protein
MKNDRKTIENLKYIKQPLSEHGISMIYMANNIKYDRSMLYSDFVLSLLGLVFETYMGDEITNSSERIKHFNWCWDKNLDNFKKEGVIFTDVQNLNSYFLEFTFEVFYSLEDKENNKQVTSNIISLWKFMFQQDGKKSQSDVDSFIEIYNLFEKSLKK